jgi:hypothetical protein
LLNDTKIKEPSIMGHTRRTEEQPEQQLWEQLDKVRAGMLGIEGSHSHMQPMAH